VLLAIAAAAIFAAGLSLGGQIGRDSHEQAALEAFVDTYQRIREDYVGDVDPNALLDGAIKGMFDALGDPYSAYMSPDEYDASLSSISGQFEGIGASMATQDGAGLACQPISETCQLLVVQVLPDSPALRAGLQANDVVLSVDDHALDGKTIQDAVDLIRGPSGSDVTLDVDRSGADRSLTITRDLILSHDVSSAVLADGQVGYLRIDSFSSTAADDFTAALRELLDGGVTDVVVDVRDDPGGFVDAAVQISSQFLSGGAVFWEETADGSQHAVEVVPGGLVVDPSVGVVVLVDGGSASASEILAGALQDAGRASLVGETTFGKGTVQEWTQLPGENGGFRLSVAKWLTRDKRWVHGVGLTPDVAVAPGPRRFRPGQDAGPGTDAQLARAVSLLLDNRPMHVAAGGSEAPLSDAARS